MADSIEDTLDAAATKPKKVSGDAGSVEMPSVPELIQLADRTAAKTGGAKNHLGLRFVKLVPSGPADQ